VVERSDDVSLIDGTCVVTGANGGLGKAVCIELARRGATVVMVCRDGNRGEDARQEVAVKSGSARVELAVADLASQQDVRRLARELEDRWPSIRALILTAAVYHATRRVTPDGLEEMFATNYLAPYALTRLLLPALDRGAPAHIVVVSAPATTPPHLDDLQGERRFRSLHAFGASMMGKVMFAFSLSRKVEPGRIKVIAYHPGLMRTRLMREAPAPLRFLSNLFSRSPDRAARHVADIVSGDLPVPSGSFIAVSKVREPPRMTLDRDFQDRLWVASAGIAGLSHE
jgi:NAD(P)-dependent dehydrogenase (short-subunit alcohol dehydrogenase family)